MEPISAFYIAGLPRIFFGTGTFSGLHKIIQPYGHDALIITGGESLKKSGRLDALTLQLDQGKIRYRTVSVRGEPTAKSIDTIASEFRKTPVSVVVAIGGGSVLDCGKAVAAMLAETGSVCDYLEDVGDRKPSGAKVPFIAVPTTAGTGSEATKNAVVCDRSKSYKKSLRHDAYMPDAAVVDPELTLGAPRQITAACGLDAVAQLIESYTSTRANVFTDSLALKALLLASESLLPLCLDRKNDISLRGKMSYAALISGITLSHAGLGAVHGMAGPLGGLFPVPHGVACGKLLHPVMSLVIKKIIDENNIAAQKRFADIGRLLTVEAGGEDVFYCRHFLDVLHTWTQTLELPQLSCFGMTAADIEKISSLADSKNSPAVLSREEMNMILESVL
jgi:alcohol dehydrogenase class IV